LAGDLNVLLPEEFVDLESTVSDALPVLLEPESPHHQIAYLEVPLRHVSLHWVCGF
jgi:hypothetical protein